MKIIHTSDWHLGARLKEEDRVEEHKAFLDWLLDQMKAEKPDALLVAGDVFDVKAPSPATQELYYEFLSRVLKSGTCQKIVIVAGNHDNAGLLAAPSRLLKALDITVVARAQGGEGVTDEIVEVKDENGETGLVIVAVPFMYEAELANFGAEEIAPDAPRAERVTAGWSRHYAEAIAAARAQAPGVPLVVTGHCTLAGADVSDDESERCRRIGGLDAYDASPFAAADYVALGHLHKPQPVRSHETKMFYSGSPLRMSFDEAGGRKFVNVVTFGAAGAPPDVRLIEVPQTVPILNIDGTPAEVGAKLQELVTDKAKLRYVRIRLKDFEGEARPHLEKFRLLVKGTQTLILDEIDLRPQVAVTTGLKAFDGMHLQKVPPHDMAKQKLKTSNRHFSPEEVADYLALFDEVAAEVNGGVA